MIIRQAYERDKHVWDDFVSSQPDTTPYHLFGWKTTIEKSYGHTCIYLMAYENKSLQGILPLVKIKSPFRKTCLVSLPFCDIGGVISQSSAIARELVAYALQICRSAGVARLELRLPKEDGLLHEFGHPTSLMANKVRMLRSLPESSDNLWDSFTSKLRSQIRKAQKNNLVFQWGSRDRINDFYAVFSRNMRDLGSPVHAVDWFKSLLSSYNSSARLGLVSLGNKVVGGGILLTINNMVCVPWASTLRTHNRLAPNMLLYWNFLKYAADDGYAHFDFGRSTPGESTFKFKKQWGAKPSSLYWYTTFINEPRALESDAKNSLRTRAEMVWQKLPLPLANFLGPKIRKYISL